MRLPGSIIERRTGPPDSPSPPPYLAHPRSATYLFHRIFASRFPTSQETYTRGRCCARMASAVETLRRRRFRRTMRDTLQGQGIPENSVHRRHLWYQHRGFFRLHDTVFSELGSSLRKCQLPRQRRQGSMRLQDEQRQRHGTRYDPDSTGVSYPRIPVFQKHLSHDCRLPPSNFSSLQQVEEVGGPLQHYEYRR